MHFYREGIGIQTTQNQSQTMSSIAQITGSSPAMLKKLEAEVRLVFSIAVRDFGFDAHAVESIIQSRGYAAAITSNKTETKEEKKERVAAEKLAEKERIKKEKAEEKKKAGGGRGRPQKSVKQIVLDGAAENVKDLVGDMVRGIPSESDCESEGEPAAEEPAAEPEPKAEPKKRGRKPSPDTKEKEAEKTRIKKEKEAEKERIKKEKEAEKERIKKEKEAEKERIKKEKEAEKEAEKERTKKEKDNVKTAIINENKTDAAGQDEEEETEEYEDEVEVSKFEHKGIIYLRDDETGILYDKDTQEPIGTINPDTGEIDPATIDDDDEE